jgi:hypothetical protein
VVAIYVAWLRLLRPAPVPAGEGGPDAIEVRDGARRHFVPLSEVAFIEAAGNYVELHRGAVPILHRAPLAQMERQLQGQGFVRNPPLAPGPARPDRPGGIQALRGLCRAPRRRPRTGRLAPLSPAPAGALIRPVGPIRKRARDAPP